MPKINLQIKKPQLKITRLTATNHNYIAINDPDNFTLLTDNRCEEEKFSRVDVFSINHYYLIGTEWLCEKIFYPSDYGIEKINKEENHPYKRLYKILLDEGIGIMHERLVPNIKKPVKRVNLECKPKRMQLECND